MTLGASAAVAAGVVVLWGGVGVAVADSEVPGSLVEDYVFPRAEEVLESYGLRVFTGDGNIDLESAGKARCAVGLVEVDAFVGETLDHQIFCFRTAGKRGFLTMELVGSFGVRGGDKPLEATAVLPDGETETYDVPVNVAVPIIPRG